MVDATRRFWFNNEDGTFDLGGRPVTRREFHEVGGPSPEFKACEICQQSEWLSRLERTDRHDPHKCPTAEDCRARCEKQGDDRWTNYHQDHFFAAMDVVPELDAPKGALLLHEGASQHKWFWTRNCNAGLATFRQKLAWVGTANTEVRGDCQDWAPYDWAWMVNKGVIDLFPRPPVPLVMYGHDMWRGNKQEVLDHFKPDVLFTPFPTPWKQNMDIPKGTEVVFTPACVSPFFARPNLDAERKQWDLLVVGALGSHFYAPRRALNVQLESLPSRFVVAHSHAVGSKRAGWFGPLDDATKCYMNKWAEKLGMARFVTFGGCKGRAKEMLLIKYFECLASGAVPILPEVRDMGLLGLEPMVHYIPFVNIENNNHVLAYLLDRYERYAHIARNAVEWYEQNAHEMIFGTFEKMVRGITGEQYPTRKM